MVSCHCSNECLPFSVNLVLNIRIILNVHYCKTVLEQSFKFHLGLMERIWLEKTHSIADQSPEQECVSVRHTSVVYGLYLSSCQMVETWGQAILLQQTDLSIKVVTVQLLQHYHPEPPGEQKHTLTSVLSKLFPPSITFTRAPAAQVMLGTLLETLSQQLATHDEQPNRSQKKHLKANSVTDQVKSQVKAKSGRNYRSEGEETGGRNYKHSDSLCFWESDTSLFPLLSAFWQLHHITISHHSSTVTWYKTQIQSYHLLMTFCKIKCRM